MEYDVTRRGLRAGSVSVTQVGLNTVFESDCGFTDGVLKLAAVCGDRVVTLGVMAPECGRLRLVKKLSKNALREIGYAEPMAFMLIAAGESLTSAEVARAAESVAQPAAVEVSERVAAPAPPIAVARQIADVARLTIEPIVAGEQRVIANTPLPAAVTPPPVGTERAIAELAAAPEFSRGIPQSGVAAPSLPSVTEPTYSWRAEPNARTLFQTGDAVISGEPRGALSRMDEDATYLAVPMPNDEPFPMMPVFCFGSAESIDGREYVVFKIKNGILTL
ncbi:MAG: hypothetical protein LBN30_06605 [Oscillospiraceae bacterium]|jgi:hypothetical protein|nr:hypothetical protein [Oscillospiraceae bacterium]